MQYIKTSRSSQRKAETAPHRTLHLHLHHLQRPRVCFCVCLCRLASALLPRFYFLSLPIDWQHYRSPAQSDSSEAVQLLYCLTLRVLGPHRFNHKSHYLLFFVPTELTLGNIFWKRKKIQFSSVAQSCPTLCDPWIAARQASLSITNSRSLLKLTSIESVMPSSHLILCCPLLLLPPIPPSIRVFSNESTLRKGRK